jgi:hypothetical protein
MVVGLKKTFLLSLKILFAITENGYKVYKDRSGGIYADAYHRLDRTRPEGGGEHRFAHSNLLVYSRL